MCTARSQNPNVYKHYKRLTRWNANQCHSLRTIFLIFETFQVLFPTASLIFTAVKVFIRVIYQKEWSIKLSIDNGGWHETLNLLHVSRTKMLHFVTSYMKHNKSRKQTLERLQYGLEISFKSMYTHGKTISCTTLSWEKFHALITLSLDSYFYV